ncbi:hypothetical protein ABBQ38_004690 [Trebouxia sp. C0009 RCD-2024]
MGKRKAAPTPDVTQEPQQTPGGQKPAKQAKTSTETPGFKNKEKVLLLSSRGITHRSRHLMLDLAQLLPHCKRDAKLDTKTDRGVINEVADMKCCSSVLFFEARKRKDLYVWLARAPDGPSVKFHCANVHTMAELKLSGNHLKGSRPILSFDSAFDQQPHLQLMKEMFTQSFATPRRHPKSKPFHDHVISFHFLDNRIWLRNYQVVPGIDKKKASADSVSLVEVGPRVCLNPIKIFGGSFGGPVLFDNPHFVSPNRIRALLKKREASKYGAKVSAKAQRREHQQQHQIPHDDLADVFK